MKQSSAADIQLKVFGVVDVTRGLQSNNRKFFYCWFRVFFCLALVLYLNQHFCLILFLEINLYYSFSLCLTFSLWVFNAAMLS